MLNKIFTKARVYDFRGVIVDTAGEMLPDADLRLSCDIDERKAIPVLICQESLTNVKSLTDKFDLSRHLTDNSFFQASTPEPYRSKGILLPEDFVKLSQHLLGIGIKSIEAYVTSHLANVISVKKGNDSIRSERVRKSGFLSFPKVYLLNRAYTTFEQPRVDTSNGAVLYLSTGRIMRTV